MTGGEERRAEDFAPTPLVMWLMALTVPYIIYVALCTVKKAFISNRVYQFYQLCLSTIILLMQKKDINERVEAQQDEIRELENRVKELETELVDLARIINNLLTKNKDIKIFCKMLVDSRLNLHHGTHQPRTALPELDQGDVSRVQLNFNFT